MLSLKFLPFFFPLKGLVWSVFLSDSKVRTESVIVVVKPTEAKVTLDIMKCYYVVLEQRSNCSKQQNAELKITKRYVNIFHFPSPPILSLS